MRDVPADAAHVPVLLRETAALMLAGGPRRVVDGTLGLGGHAGELLGSDAELRLLGIDRDGSLVRAARARLAAFGTRFMAVQGSYADLLEHMAKAGWEHADGVLLDLGYCSAQVDDPARGFSFNRDAPLDLRFAPEEGETAADLVARLTEEELAAVISTYGEERAARRIARALKEALPRTTGQLAAAVSRVKGRGQPERIHPATRAFQALRIAVNGELEHLGRFLRRFHRALSPGGRAVVIAYHSLEDRMVKEAFARLHTEGLGTLVTKHALRPSPEEVKRNRRSRSARLRAFALKAA